VPRRVTAFLVVPLAALAVAAACSETTKYRVFSFFLDGVPPPGQPPPNAAAEPAPKQESEGDQAPQPPLRVKQYYAHAPYRDNRCGGCHDIETGQMVKSVAEGLCLSCHDALVKDIRYLHGPVAVNGCTLCHHHHSSPYPKLLLADPTETCLGCHDRDDLTTGEHHAALDRQSCVECHDPHGEADRFFLKRGQP